MAVDHLEFCRQLNGQLRRLRAAQNAIDISGGATKWVYLVDSVGEQTVVFEGPCIRDYDKAPTRVIGYTKTSVPIRVNASEGLRVWPLSLYLWCMSVRPRRQRAIRCRS